MSGNSFILSSILSEENLNYILLTLIESILEETNQVNEDPINEKNIEELEKGSIE